MATDGGWTAYGNFFAPIPCLGFIQEARPPLTARQGHIARYAVARKINGWNDLPATYHPDLPFL